MAKLYKFLVFALMLVATTTLYAQNYTVSGVVTNAQTGEKLIGANVILVGTSLGAASDQNGKYSISAPAGNYTLRVSYIGYATQKVQVNLNNNAKVNVDLTVTEFTLSLNVIADRAKERETPVAFSNVTKKDMELMLGSQDIPMVLNTTPSVYATMQGGGAGDARINVRGFNQRNVAIMINGVPVNDMENGWVYWSNWDGVGDATSSIQVQRGLSAVNLATPSIGGTINIITDPTAQKFGVKYKQEFGNDAFLKSTLSFNSGLVNKKFAINGTIVRKTGDGTISKAWTDSWAYYFGATYNINSKNRIELYALGAPQRHGQNLYKQNIAAYSQSFASGLPDYNKAAFSKFHQTKAGRLYNQNWQNVNPSYSGKQWWNGATHNRYNSNFINERENYFHKPIINFNWYSQFSNKVSLYTTMYWSGGKGGGSGTYGNVYRRDANGKLGDKSYKFYYGPSPWSWDWNQTIAMNSGAAGNYYVDKRKIAKVDGQSIGILRNSVNQQWTIGAISKAFINFSENFKMSFGIDWRKAEIEHFREVRDLLGGKFYNYTGNDFDTTPAQQRKGLGDKIAYYNTNTVDWLGFYGQGEYTKDKWTVYATYGWSTIKYSYLNHFKKDPKTGKALFTQSGNINGYQLKGGVSYRATGNVDLYANVGLVHKVPILDKVIDDRGSGALSKNPANEKFTSYEFGLNLRSTDGRITAKFNYYYTRWNDRSFTKFVRNADGSDGLLSLFGVNQKNSGLEFESAWQPNRYFRLDAAASIGSWNLTNDPNGVYTDYASGVPVQKKYNLYLKGIKVGDAPQTQLALAGSILPVYGMTIQAVYRYYSNYYANWDPLSRSNPNDRGQSWKIPNYGLVDFNFSYDLPLNFKSIGIQIFAHVYNVFDKLYVSDAVDNSRYNAYTSDGKNHKADDAEVFMGIPRIFNLGVRVSL